jgi:protocatechuate 3,4-dioxygenase beta subunit
MHITKYLIMLFVSIMFVSGLSSQALGETCQPTKEDMLGPFYKPDTPVRSSVGKGYILSGEVKSAADCIPIMNARIEFWLTGPDGKYGDAYRATVFSDDNGIYTFESNSPKGYFFRPPHIHVRVSAQGFQTLITQHYPAKGKTSDIFDLVLIPE